MQFPLTSQALSYLSHHKSDLVTENGCIPVSGGWPIIKTAEQRESDLMPTGHIIN